MEQQSNQINQPVIPVTPSPKKSWLITIIIIVALIASTSIYLWQKSVSDKQRQASERKIIELQNQISQLQQQKQQEDLYKDWQTYRNEEGGYLLKYPKEWNAVTNKYNPKNALFGPGATSESGYGGVEFAGTLSSDQSLKDFVKKLNEGIEAGSISETETIINGRSVIVSILPKAAIEPQEVKSVSFEKNGKVFNIFLMYKTDFIQYPDDKQRLNTFNQILSTFKFIDETANWQTYQNEEIGFEFKYPSSFSDIEFIKRKGGDSGELFTGSASSEKLHLSFGGNSKDFSEGREGFITDSQGYVKENNKYYYANYYPDPESGQIKQGGSSEIKPDSVEIIDDEKVLIFKNKPYYTMALPGEEELIFYYNAALINLKKNKDFSGMIIFIRNQEPNEKQKLSAESSKMFDQILSTFKFIE